VDNPVDNYHFSLFFEKVLNKYNSDKFMFYLNQPYASILSCFFLFFFLHFSISIFIKKITSIFTCFGGGFSSFFRSVFVSVFPDFFVLIFSLGFAWVAIGVQPFGFGVRG